MAKASYTYDEKGVRSGSDTSHHSYVEMKSAGEYVEAKLIVEGKELMFIEFGAGVFTMEQLEVASTQRVLLMA